MKNVDVTTMVSRILVLLQEAGLSPKQLKEYGHYGFGAITKYFAAQGSTSYSLIKLNIFMLHIRECYEQGEISRWRWQQIRRSVVWLEEFSESGSVTLDPLAKWETLNNPLRKNPSEAQLENKDNLFVLVYQTKQELSGFGLSKKTLLNYTYDGFDAILRYCIQRGITEYSKSILTDFVSEARFTFENQQMCRSVYQNARKAAALLEEYHDNGKLDWHRLPAWGIKALSPHYSLIVNDYCEIQQRNRLLSDGTISTSKSAIRQFLFCLEDMGIYDSGSITRSILNDCILVLTRQYPCGLQNCIIAIRSFLTFLYDRELINDDLQNAIPTTSSPRRAIRYGFSPKELEQLLMCADRSTTIGKRDYAMMMLAVQTGLRVVDISNLTFQNIDWRGSEFHITQSKTGKALFMPMEPESGNALADYILNGRPTCTCPFIFLSNSPPHRKLHSRSASSIVSRYIKKCGIDRETIPRRGFHSFRRSFGARLLQSEIPLEMLSELLGHTNIDSSKPYLAIDETGLRACALGLSGIEVKAGELKA